MKKVLILFILALLTFVGCSVQDKGDSINDLPPTIILNSWKYYEVGMPENELPEGYVCAGTLTKEQAGETNLDGCKYFVNLYYDSIPDIYVYQECGTPIGENAVDSQKMQWAYTKWVHPMGTTNAKAQTLLYNGGEYRGLTVSDEEPENNDHQIAMKPCVMVDGKLYGDTGYVFSAISRGMMDGTIDSTVDGTKLPEVNNQSNFGTGFSYQLGDGTIIVVVIDGQRIIFRDMEYSGTDIPKQVANFTAEVKETLENGNLLVSFISAPDLFSHTPNGEYEVPTENLSGEVAAGDIVRVWYDGMVTESSHGDSLIQLGVVYRIEKAG